MSDMSEERYRSLSKKYETNPPLFPYTLEMVVVDGVNYYVGWINEAGARDNGGGDRGNANKDMYLYPADLVDVNA